MLDEKGLYFSCPRGMLPWDDFVAALASPTPSGVRKTDAMLHFGQRMAGRDQLEDDFALVRLEFVRP